ncbi:hypothetical protein [Kaistella jeonii]|uniref:Transcription elongation factor n=1 Tax=Kaistella jeonii TaxID=266749 RepID=A0A0C1D666_9FLAO|nr:hypothetical protein [Kaistella jeonii]KIA89305.1 hypothetical protein OA86_06820 [Kaistella jeonii]SFC02353.1 hypothetical protein SAMN05421876_10586 [Kaistella jeonii]VEI96619.1 Uncharacterised protein [Kaistella jeonii]
MNRKNILNKIIQEQNKVIESLQQSVDQYKTASDIDEESTHDSEDFTNQSIAKDMQLRFEKMMTEAVQNLNFLEKEKEIIHTEIENGSLIETDKNFLFIGISVPVFKVESKEVISFSEKAPIFKEIKGKNTGDTVKIGDDALKILSIN